MADRDVACRLHQAQVILSKVYEGTSFVEARSTRSTVPGYAAGGPVRLRIHAEITPCGPCLHLLGLLE